MRSFGRFAVLALSLACAPHLATASPALASASTPSWDLSYRSLLRKHGIGKGEWLAKWLNTHRGAPTERTLRSLGKNQILSAVLIEYPAFHAGERVTFLFARTEKGAFCWNFVDGKPREFQAKPLDAAAFDLLVKELLSWEQGPPILERDAPLGAPGGYFAFLSVQDGMAAKQLLLTLRDFKESTDPNWADGNPGRVYRAFGSVIRLYD